MVLQDDNAYFKVRVAVLVNSLKNRFDELTSRDFPNSSPNEVIALIKQALTAIGEQVKVADEKILPLIFSLLRTYQEVLSYLDNAHTEQTPRGLVRILRDLLNRVSAGARFVASPQSAYNYGIVDVQPYLVTPLTNLLPASELHALPPISLSRIHLILFPRAERDNILVHAVFGHEIGHLIATEFLSEEENEPDFQAGFQSVLEQISKTDPAPPETDPMAVLRRRAEIANRVAQIRKRAMEELISDYVGAMLFGPSALLASYEIFLLNPIDLVPSGSDLYPPSRYRLRFLLDAIEKEGFINALTQCGAADASCSAHMASALTHFQRIAAIVADQTDLNALKSDVLIDAAYGWVKNSLEKAKAFVRKRLDQDLIYPVDAFRGEVPELIGRLVLNVPPSELGIYPKVTLPTWQSALLAGWFVRIHGKRQTNDGEVMFGVAEHDAIQRLVLRAVENIGLHKEYLEHMAGAV
ncbi:hypothetical protein KDW60_30120 [Burkholderia cenocepacia]|uniref:hypothetical protein n=1 Tax=Burkholderia cenocepacia TaxID=95486 RepID=UPI001B9CAA40|nr:hypothetical protein [Burkholderia cenocepacia]MBR7940987.1 hypothetical protein [Burkholderia cenocepacia]MBR8479189.1 hypothetical protein [Burkholderia cenocepacia]